MINRFKKVFSFVSKTNKRKIISIASIIIIILLGQKLIGGKSASPQYQTAYAEKGTLVSSISASGSITTVGNINILTQATGTVKDVYVKNGDMVVQGQKIADITLDQNSLQKSTSAYASYLSAKNSLASAQSSLYSLDSQMWSANQKFINDAVARGLAVNDPTYIQQSDDWQFAQAKYLAQQNVIAQSQASLDNSWLIYQQLSPAITAPASGKIINLTIAKSLVIASQTTSSTTSTTLQSLGTILTPNITPQAVVNLSEIDVPKVKSGQKATITLDAYADKTFTGKVLIINSNGSVSSGVTTYPATINFDTSLDGVYPNMGVNAEIIVSVKPDVLLVPSSAVQTNGKQSSVRILKDNQVVSIPVELGSSSDTQTEIISGINEGDSVITSIILPTANTSNRTPSSPFSGAIRFNR